LSPASAVAFDGGVPMRHIQRSGEFGEFVYAGMDWVGPKLAKRSIGLMAAEVMPRLNRAIGARGEKPLREGAGR